MKLEKNVLDQILHSRQFFKAFKTTLNNSSKVALIQDFHDIIWKQ